jgi:hypothetical protein
VDLTIDSQFGKLVSSLSDLISSESSDLMLEYSDVVGKLAELLAQVMPDQLTSALLKLLSGFFFKLSLLPFETTDLENLACNQLLI